MQSKFSLVIFLDETSAELPILQSKLLQNEGKEAVADIFFVGGSNLDRDAIEAKIKDFHFEVFSTSKAPVNMAFQQALHRARGEYLLFIEASTLPTLELLHAHRSLHEQLSGDVGVFGKCSLADPQKQSMLAHSAFEAIYLQNTRGLEALVPYGFEYGSFGNSSYRRETLTSCSGLFAMNYSSFWAYQFELAYKLWCDGLRYYYCEGATLQVSRRFSSASFINDQRMRGKDTYLLTSVYPALTALFYGVSVYSLIDPGYISQLVSKGAAEQEALVQVESLIASFENEIADYSTPQNKAVLEALAQAVSMYQESIKWRYLAEIRA